MTSLHAHSGKRTVLRHFLTYGIGGAASRLAAVFLVPIYTRALPVGLYGQLELIVSIQTLAVLLSGFQSESAVLRDFHVAKASGTLPQLKWASLGLSVCGSAGLSILTLFVFAFGSLGREIVPLLPIVLALTLAAQVLGLEMVILRFSGRPVLFALVAFLDVSVSAATSILFIFGFHFAVGGALLGMLTGKLVAGGIAWGSTFGLPARPAPSVSLYRRLLSYGAPTIPSVVLNWIQTSGARVLLAIFLSLADVAIVSVAIRVAAIFGFLTYSFRLAWEPYAFGRLDRGGTDPAVYDRALQWYITFMLPASAVAILASPALVRIFAPPAYLGAVPLVGCFIVGQFWVGLGAITMMGIYGARVTSRLTHVYAAGAAVNVAALAALSPAVGGAGAGIGFFLSSAVSALFGAFLSRRHFAILFSVKLLAWSLAASIAFAAASWFFMGRANFAYFDPRSWGILAALGLVLSTIYGFLFAFVLPSRTRAEVIGWLRSGLGRAFG